ncbi:hypothetical protein [Streptomyces sp. enrichment culture]|uniref:hypothetical protein n=1 Tax=Streptomyces sp. enrichment culture TaxID=1795815 RepID=UPI003F573E29
MKYGRWVAGTASAAAVVGLALYVDGMRTGHTDGGLLATTPEVCVGRQAGSGVDERGTDDTPLYRTLARIDELAAGRHAEVYTGLVVDEDANAADVWRIPSDAFDTAVCAAAEKGVEVRLHDADASRRDLDALAERIGEDMNRWDGTFQLREVGVDEHGWVEVGVDDPDVAAPLIADAFGSDHIEVVHADQAMLN